ncbi:hypothetical protein ACFP1I_09065 [Dyadobacter subterraneus]|uniref:Lipoprotein n=1 Tax=Dyadobacter subterraneus TaxID=2773304 RepID=A0ABR9WB98_9BACT|nr:hypothetical protein [Dyadobacter subterraneus]MBE9462748.1 hypothetical protein [Dyadobacter subterraneus]
MKKYLYLPLILVCLGCKTTSKNETPVPDADVSGKYHGIISMSDLIGVPNINHYKTSKDTLNVTVEKIGDNYILHGFDTVDLTVPVSQQKGWNIPVNINASRVLSSTISFAGDSLTIQGNWRYTYIEGQYDSTSINKRNYIFVGYKK